LQDYYDNTIKYKDMFDKFIDGLAELEMLGYKFNRTDKNKNKKIGDKYKECVKLFFRDHKTIPYKVLTEKYLLVKIGGYLFQGYADAIHK
jgi:hypothetical protein